MGKNELEERTKQFSLSLIKLARQFPKSDEGRILLRQLIRSGTSIGANYREANRAVSRADFIHRVGIAEKEAAETEYWLELCSESGICACTGVDKALKEAFELIAILTTIGRNAKRPQST